MNDNNNNNSQRKYTSHSNYSRTNARSAKHKKHRSRSGKPKASAFSFSVIHKQTEASKNRAKQSTKVKQNNARPLRM